MQYDAESNKIIFQTEWVGYLVWSTNKLFYFKGNVSNKLNNTFNFPNGLTLLNQRSLGLVSQVAFCAQLFSVFPAKPWPWDKNILKCSHWNQIECQWWWKRQWIFHLVNRFRVIQQMLDNGELNCFFSANAFHLLFHRPNTATFFTCQTGNFNWNIDDRKTISKIEDLIREIKQTILHLFNENAVLYNWMVCQLVWRMSALNIPTSISFFFLYVDVKSQHTVHKFHCPKTYSKFLNSLNVVRFAISAIFLWRQLSVFAHFANAKLSISWRFRIIQNCGARN